MQSAAHVWLRRLAQAGVLAACLLPCVALRAAPDVEQLADRAAAARYRSPVEARALTAELRERLADRPDRPDRVLEARSYLTDCQSLIEDDNRQAVVAAAQGRAALARLPAPGDEVLAARLALCDLTAREYLGEIKDSMSGYDRLVAEAERLGDAGLLAEAQVARGELRGYLGRYAEALEDLQRGCRYYRERTLEDESLYCQQSVAVIYYRLGEWDRAIDYLDEVAQARRRRGQTQMLAEAVFNMARALEGKGEIDAAIARYEEMEALSLQLGSATAQAYAREALGALLGARGEAGRGLALLDASLDVFRGLGDTDMTARVQRRRGEALLGLGRDAEAIAALEEAVRLYRSLEQRPGLESSYRALGDAYRRAGDYRRAAEALVAEREVHGQLDAERGEGALALQRARLEAERRGVLNERLEAQRRLQDVNERNARRVDRLKTTISVLSASLLVVALLFLLRQWRLSARLRALALVDELTGIGNRRSVLAFLDEQIRSHRDSGKPLSVATLDIDRFKQLNDRHGHAAGDEALKTVARLCQQVMRGNDKIGRIGGEEFLAVLPDASLLDAGDVGARLCEQVRRLSLDQVAPGLRITVSVGVSQWRPDDENAESVVKRADTALYQAKAEGRDCVRLAGS